MSSSFLQLLFVLLAGVAYAVAIACRCDVDVVVVVVADDVDDHVVS